MSEGEKMPLWKWILLIAAILVFLGVMFQSDEAEIKTDCVQDCQVEYGDCMADVEFKGDIQSCGIDFSFCSQFC